MKIIKPLRLGVLHRPWRWQGRNRLGVSILALADMGPKPRLRPEPELWQLAAAELTGCGGLLDLAIPKSCAEFLATGYAFTRHQPQKDACMVKIQVAEREKSLVAFGDRFWTHGRPSPAQPFERLRLDWENAFGGPDDTLNPQGKGAAPLLLNEVLCHPLANIERPGQGQTPRRRVIAPVCFGPLDFASPANFKRIGQRYDQQWLEQEYPGFARDIDWRVFNRADSDQQWPDAALPAGATWSIWNMHPRQPVQRGVLPPWQARCFIQRAGIGALEELALRATTLWFFPHLERMVLIWQGSCAVNEDDALDVEQLLAAVELQHRPHPAAHYQDVWRQRGEKATGAAFTLREQDLVAPETIGPWLDTEPQTAASPLADRLAEREKYLRARYPASADPAAPAMAPLPSGPAAGDLPDFMARLDRQAAELQRRAQENAAAMAATAVQPSGTGGPAGYYRMRDLVQRRGVDARSAELDGLHEAYRLSADTRPPAAPCDRQTSATLRQRVLAVMGQGRDFRGMDLTGADLSGLDLRQGDFQRALFESARLDNCLLDGANLRQAMLAHASLQDASLQGAQLQDACLTGANCQRSRFNDAHFRETLLQQARFEHCSFDGARLEGLLFYQTTLNRCGFNHARLENCVFMQPNATGLDFSQGRLEKCTFLQGTLRDTRFTAASLLDCSFVTMDVDALVFDNCRLDSCAFTARTHARRATFRAARLAGCNFRQTPLPGADFSQAQAQRCDFSACDLTDANLSLINAGGCLFIRADLTRATLDDANLIGALLQKCRLTGTHLRNANLFRADLSQSQIDAKTCLSGAYLHQCKTLPRAQEPT